MFLLWCTSVLILEICFIWPLRWSSNTYSVSITRWQMDSLNRPWNWIWVMELSLKIWMVWSLIMAILFYFSDAESHVFSAFHFQRLIDHIYILCLRPLSQQVLLRNVCLTIIFDLTQHILTWYFRDDEKSLLWSDFFSLFWMVVDRFVISYVYVMFWFAIVLSVIEMVYVNDVFWFSWITKTGIFSSEKTY